MKLYDRSNFVKFTREDRPASAVLRLRMLFRAKLRDRRLLSRLRGGGKASIFDNSSMAQIEHFKCVRWGYPPSSARSGNNSGKLKMADLERSTIACKRVPGAGCRAALCVANKNNQKEKKRTFRA